MNRISPMSFIQGGAAFLIAAGSIGTAGSALAQTNTFARVAAMEVRDVSFDQARLDDLLLWLSHETDRLDGDTRSGLQFVMLDDGDAPIASQLITLNLAKMPVSELLHYIVDMSGGIFKVEDKAIVVGSLARVTAKTRDAAQAIRRGPGAAGQYLQLSELVIPELSWHEAPLGDVLDSLRAHSARDEEGGKPLNIVLSAEDQAAFAATPISLDLRNVSARVALDYACRQIGCDFYLEDDAVIVATLDRIPSAPVRLYSANRAQGAHDALHVKVPKVDFSGVTVDEAIEWIRQVADTAGTPINLIDANVPTDDAANGGAWERQFDLTLTDVRLGRVLDYVCILGGGRYETQPLAVQVTEAPPKPEPKPEATQRERLPKAFDPFAEEEEASFFSRVSPLAGHADRGLFAKR